MLPEDRGELRGARCANQALPGWERCPGGGVSYQHADVEELVEQQRRQRVPRLLGDEVMPERVRVRFGQSGELLLEQPVPGGLMKCWNANYET